jgi:hypothetical protein
MGQTLILDRLFSAQLIELQASARSDRTLRAPPTIKGKLATTTTSPEHHAYQTEARGVCQVHHIAAKETSPLVPAFSSTMRGRPRTMTAVGTLRPAIGLRLCLPNKSKKSLTPSKWYVLYFWLQCSANTNAGDGGSRVF